MMKKGTGRLPPRDLEALSAYLDGELAPRERAKLEARLEASPALRQALEELRLVKGALRELPQAAPARRFTLTPEMVGLAQRRRRYPVMQLATALAAVAFLLTVGVDALLISGPLAARQLAAPSEPVVMPEAAQEHEMMAAEAPPVEGEERDLQATVPPTAGIQEEEAEAPRFADGLLPTPTIGVGAAEKVAETEVAITPTGSPEALAAAPPAEETPLPSLADEVEGGMPPAPLSTPAAETEAAMELPAEPIEPAVIEPQPIPWLRALEISLAGLTLLLGGLTLVLRRR